MWYSCISTLAIWVYIEEDVVFIVICNPNTSISKIVDLLRPFDEWAEIAFSGRQNAENELCETLKKIVHKLRLQYWTCLYKTLNMVFVYCYSTNLILNETEEVFEDISNPNTSISKIIDLVRPVDEWSEIAFSYSQNAENEQCYTLKTLVHKLNYHQ